MTDTTVAAAAAPKKRKAAGPRKPSPLYVFLTVDASLPAGKQAVAKAQFRDPRKMAEYFPTATENGEQLLIVTPEA